MYCTLKLLTNLLKIFIIITNFYYMITYFIIIFSAVKPQYNGIVWMRKCLYKRKSVVSKFPMQWTLLVLLIDKISVQWSQIVVGGYRIHTTINRQKSQCNRLLPLHRTFVQPSVLSVISEIHCIKVLLSARDELQLFIPPCLSLAVSILDSCV